MQVIETFGHYVEKWSAKSPKRARRLLKTGWEAQNLKFRFTPDKRLLPADQHLANMMMDAMLKPLKDPEHSVMVSIFTPCELLQEAGLNPYNVEGFSCYLSGSKAERAFLQAAEDFGLSETLCSYHKTFIGAALNGILPKPRCIVYTSLACDANLLTFKEMADLYQVPCFAIDIPAISDSGQDTKNIAYVAGQLRDLTAFLEKNTGRKIDEEKLRERLKRSRRTLETYDAFQKACADKYVPTDLVSPLYSGMTQNILLGTREEAEYVNRLLKDLEKAEPSKGKRIYWMHTIPFWSDAVKKELLFNEKAQIVGCELAQVANLEHHSDDPYEDMAMRLYYHALNGSITRRIDAGIRHAKEAKADGAIWFNHWGCKHTLGGSQLAKRKFEAEGIPMLILDGDGCDRSHGGEGQTSTRLGAFLEMLNE
ncbi:MAG: 2-hydroxyacyl-CoA dehydratase family protein [Lachnospiraceae bacterium]|nr:2-hydroxyacyl-CoA dehydratase family protein [Lachnospiraceae bacterium]